MCWIVPTSATSLLITGELLPNDVQPPPPPGHPLIHHFSHGRLCRPQVVDIDQFQTPYYHLESSGLCRAQDPLECQLTACTETLDLLDCSNFRNFTPDDWCTLA